MSSTTMLEKMRSMESLSAHDILTRIDDHLKGPEFKVVTPCLDNYFTLFNVESKEYWVMRYHVGRNEAIPIMKSSTKAAAREFIFDRWAKLRRAEWSKDVEEWEAITWSDKNEHK